MEEKQKKKMIVTKAILSHLREEHTDLLMKINKNGENLEKALDNIVGSVCPMYKTLLAAFLLDVLSERMGAFAKAEKKNITQEEFFAAFVGIVSEFTKFRKDLPMNKPKPDPEPFISPETGNA